MSVVCILRSSWLMRVRERERTCVKSCVLLLFSPNIFTRCMFYSFFYLHKVIRVVQCYVFVFLFFRAFVRLFLVFISIKNWNLFYIQFRWKMAHSNGWSKKCHRTSVFHNVNSRSIFGPEVVQPFLINSSKGMYNKFNASKSVIFRKSSEKFRVKRQSAKGHQSFFVDRVDISSTIDPIRVFLVRFQRLWIADKSTFIFKFENWFNSIAESC